MQTKSQLLDRTSPIAAKLGLGAKIQAFMSEVNAGARFKVAKAVYDFAVNGGAIAAIPLTGDQLPSGAIILGGLVEVVTPPTSGDAATLALKIEGADDLIAATVISGVPWSTGGLKSVVPVFTGATAIKTTAVRSIVATPAVGTLTAGKFNVYLVYIDTLAADLSTLDDTP